MSSGPLLHGQQAHRRVASTALVAFVMLANGPGVAEAQNVRAPAADSGRSISDSLRSPAPLGLRALDGAEGVPGVLGSVDTTTVPLLGAGEPLEALAGTLAGVRVYRPSGEPGELPLVTLHGRTTVDRMPSPLYVFDGVPLAAPPIDIVTPGLSGIDILSAQLGASWLGSAAHDGVVHLRTGALSPPPTGFATRVRSEVGTAWNPGSFSINRHHDFLMNDAGQYVDADGNVVDRANRVRDQSGIMEKAYPGGSFDPVDALFTSGMRQSVSADLAGSFARSSLWASLGHDRDAGIVRELDAFRRTHVHARSEHLLREDLRLGFTGYYGRSAREDARLSDLLGDAFRSPADVDLLARATDGDYIRDPVPEVSLNPLWVLANASSTVERERRILGLRVAWTPLDWLAVDGSLGRDQLTRTSSYSVGYASDAVRPLTRRTEREHALASLTSTAVAVTARRKLPGVVDSRATLAWTRMPLRDSHLQSVEERTTCTPTSCVPPFSGSRSRSSRPPQQTFSAHLHGSLDERFAVDLSLRRENNEHFPLSDQWSTSYRAAVRSVLTSFGWWPLESLDRLVLSASRGTLVGFMSREEVYEGLLNPPIPGTPAARWQAERERETVVAADLALGRRVDVRVAQTWAMTHHSPVVTGGLPEAREWATVATLDREGFEAMVSAAVVRRENVAWTVGLTAGRQELTFAGLDMPCSNMRAQRFCVGETVGQLFGGRWMHSVDDLPAIHAGSHSAFAVNDDGFLVPVGSGGSLAMPQWGTIVTIDGIDHAWGVPIPITDATGTPQFERLGDPTHWVLGLSNVVRWRGFTLAAVVSGQVGGHLWDEIGRFSVLTRQNAVLDQAVKPELLRKPYPYYDRLRGPHTTEFFVMDASHLVLQHLALRFQFGTRRLGGGAVGAQRLELAIIGRNLAAWAPRGGFFDELSSPVAHTDVTRYPRPRSLGVRLGVDF